MEAPLPPGYKVIFDPDEKELIALYHDCASGNRPEMIRDVDLCDDHPYCFLASHQQANDVKKIHIVWSPAVLSGSIIQKHKSFVWCATSGVTYILDKTTKEQIGTRQSFVLKIGEKKTSRKTCWILVQYKSLSAQFKENKHAICEVYHESTLFKRASSLMKTARVLLVKASLVVEPSERDPSSCNSTSNHSSPEEPIIKLKKVQPKGERKSIRKNGASPQVFEGNASLPSLNSIDSSRRKDQLAKKREEAEKLVNSNFTGKTSENNMKTGDKTGDKKGNKKGSVMETRRTRAGDKTGDKKGSVMETRRTRAGCVQGQS